jgi:hypothetical protein
VIGGLRARLPPGLGVGDQGAHLLPVAQVLGSGVGRHAGHADRVRQDVAHGRALLAVSAELRPQLHDRGVVIERATLYEHVCHRGGRTFARRVGVERRVRGDRASGFVIGDARCGVYHRLAVPVYGDLQTHLGSGLDEHIDGFLDLLLKDVHDPFSSQWCFEPSDISSDFRQIVVELMSSAIELASGCLREFCCV